MNKIFVVVGIKYFTKTEIYHTRTEIVQHIIGIYSTKKHADEIAEQIERANDFKMKIYGLTKNVNTRHERTNRKGKQIVEFYDVMQSVDYDVTDFIGI